MRGLKKKKFWKSIFFRVSCSGFSFVCLFDVFPSPHDHTPGAENPQKTKRGRQQANVSPYDEGSCDMWVGEEQWARGGYQSCSVEEDTKALPAGRIPMCCWPSNTKLPIGWPSGLYAAPWLTEGSRRKPDCSQSWTQRRKKRRHTKQSAIVPASALKRYIQYLGCHFELGLCFLWADYVTRTIE